MRKRENKVLTVSLETMKAHQKKTKQLKKKGYFKTRCKNNTKRLVKYRRKIMTENKKEKTPK